MSDAEPVLLPFDGSCDASKDANMTLTFDKGEPLSISSHCLLLASPVLTVAINDCQCDGTLALGADDREIWCLLLHFIHPLGVSRLFKHLRESELSEIEEILRLAQKYDMTFPAGVADTIIEPRIKAETERVSKGGIIGRQALLQKIFNEKAVLELVLWCVEYRLTDSFEACKMYVKHCLVHRDIRTRLDWETDGYGGHELTQTIQSLIGMGHPTVAATFAADLFQHMRMMD